MSAFVVPAGWYRPRRDAIAEWQKRNGSDPPANVRKLLAEQIRKIKEGMALHQELTFEHHHEVLSFVVQHGKNPTGYPSNDIGENARLVQKAIATVHAHEKHYDDTHPSFFQKLNPAKLIAAAANVVSSALPFVKTALSLIPGIGTGINMALSAAESLAKGRPITDAFADAALAAVPGGPVAQTAARTALSLAKGQRIDQALLESAKANLPPVAQKAFDVGLAIAHGRNLQDVAIEQVKNLAADQIHGLKLPIPSGIDVPLHEQGGFKIALGVLEKSHLPSGVPLTPAAALAIRSRLEPAAKAGFDRAMSMRALKHLRAGSAHVPRPRIAKRSTAPHLKGATFITADGQAVRIGGAWLV